MNAAVEWRMRTGGHRVVHAFTCDGVGLCTMARMPPGTVTAYQGRRVTGFVPAELSPAGHPYGKLCRSCLSAVRRVGTEALP